MLNKVLLALIVALPLTAFAVDESQAKKDEKSLAPEVQWSRKGSYIYRKQAWRVTWDAGQQAALKESTAFISGQLQNLGKKNALDPDGDLAAINSSVETLHAQLDTLVGAAGKLYGDAASYGFSRYDGLPSGILVFGGLAYDKNLMKFVKGGGSVMLGIVLVPMWVERTHVTTREVVRYTEWSSALVLIPTANAGPGISTDADTVTNKRIGAGLIWGSLNSPSELVGVTYGPSTTLALGAGLNLKVLALKNFKKEGGVNNVIVMAGVEKGTIAAETHFNVGGIMDATGFLKSIVETGTDAAVWAQNKVENAIKGEKKTEVSPNNID